MSYHFQTYLFRNVQGILTQILNCFRCILKITKLQFFGKFLYFFYNFYKKLSLKNPKTLRKAPNAPNIWAAAFKNADFSWSSFKVTKLSNLKVLVIKNYFVLIINGSIIHFSKHGKIKIEFGVISVFCCYTVNKFLSSSF